MIKLTKDQREKLIAISMGSIMVMGGLWYFGVTSLQDSLVALQKKTAKMQGTLGEGERWIRRETEIKDTLRNDNASLAKLEAGLAPEGDRAYAWLINTMNTFIQNRAGINIDTYSQPSFTESGFLQKFPYKWVTFHLKGNGYYHDWGIFFRDFENSFPYFRIENPSFSANIGPGIAPEKLSVEFDLVAPVVSGGPETK